MRHLFSLPMRHVFSRGRLAVPLLTLALVLTPAGLSGTAGAVGSAGAVYTMTNAGTGNEILAYSRAQNGTLKPLGTYATGGTGTGVPRLGSQGSVILTPDHRWLLAANPGSDDVSVFAVAPNGTLILTDREPSLGDRPESITIRGRLVYVLNTGAPNNISGYTLNGNGNLTRLQGSVRALSQEGALPAQVQFSPDGQTLVVTERNTSLIDTFKVNRRGRPSDVNPHPGSGIGPFGFAFRSAFRSDGVFVVTESFDGLADAAAASSYTLSSVDGRRALQAPRRSDGFRLLSGTVGDTQSDVCWAVITNDGRYAYVTNNGSGTISSYSIAPDGTISLLEAVAGVTGTEGGFGTRDADLDDSGAFLYAIDVGTDTMNLFQTNADGTLTNPVAYPGLPETVAGAAAY